jgi:hypothetical protein
MYQSTFRTILTFVISGVLAFSANHAQAQSKTELQLLQRIVTSLQRTDSLGYAALFPSSDTMINVTLRKAPQASAEYRHAVEMVSNPTMVLVQDSLIREQACALYRAVFERGEKLSVHWNDIILSRYELEALPKTRDQALEAIASERFVGYVYIEDMQTRKIFAIMLSEMMKIDGYWYGGELNYIFEAETKEQFNAQLKAEKIRIRKGLPDSLDLAIAADTVTKEEEQLINKRKQVSDRKLYTGMLDEIPVSLYIRYLAGDCPAKICSWEAIFKFGDNDYTKQEVSKNAEGKWVFVEEESGGVMELELNGNVFTGIFSATLDKVDYDAELKEKTMTKKKMESLDAILEKDINR